MLGFHICRKPNIEVEFDVLHFQWYLSMTIETGSLSVISNLFHKSFDHISVRKLETGQCGSTPKPGNPIKLIKTWGG